MIFICEFWCSPSRKEVYSEKYICTNEIDASYGEDEIREFYLADDFWYDVFGDNYYEIGGLYKVVVSLPISWITSQDWEGVPDTSVEFDVGVLFKDKCSCYSELKWIWLELQGKSEKYNEWLMSKHYPDGLSLEFFN